MSHPVILLGMHRSGTSMVARLLGDLGLFLGARLDVNHESLLFLRLNDWALVRAGGAWDRPEAFEEVLADAAGRAHVLEVFRAFTSGRWVRHYLGQAKALRHRSLDALPFPFGFKDPRNTITLPIWLDRFPGARVIAVHRHGVDVAASLTVRTKRDLEEARVTLDAVRPFSITRRLRGLLTSGSLRCLELDRAFALWETYEEILADRMAGLPEDRKLEIRYEDFVRDPGPALAEAARFAGLSPDTSAVSAAAAVDPAPAERFRKDADLLRFHETVIDRPLLAHYGPPT